MSGVVFGVFGGMFEVCFFWGEFGCVWGVLGCVCMCFLGYKCVFWGV